MYQTKIKCSIIIVNYFLLYLQIVSSPHQLIGDKFGDICDGYMFEEHPTFNQNSQAIQIVAYFDEMETANALGPRASKNNKLGLLFIIKFTVSVKKRIVTISQAQFTL